MMQHTVQQVGGGIFYVSPDLEIIPVAVETGFAGTVNAARTEGFGEDEEEVQL